MFSEDDLLPISALQHLLYCPRQCALIHLEQLWAENSLTVHGKHLHEKADSGKREQRPAAEGGVVRTVRSLPLRSLHWGLIGQADVVEFRTAAGDAGVQTCFPVEYKRGKPKAHEADRVQLCAQALCLEEMLGQAVPAGALFYGKTRRRLDVLFDSLLRLLTQQTIEQLHLLIASRKTPAAIYAKAKCERCSLISLCMPRTAARRGFAAGYLDRMLADVALAGPVGG